MYLPRASPTKPETTDEAASSTDAENGECAWEGCSTASERAHRERGDGGASATAKRSGPSGPLFLGEPATGVDSNVALRPRRDCGDSSRMLFA